MECNITNPNKTISFQIQKYGIADMEVEGEILAGMKEQLITQKSILDQLQIADKDSILSIYNFFSRFKQEKLHNFIPSGCRNSINTSWLKGVEILAKYRIFERYDSMTVLDTSGLPGHYTFAMKFYCEDVAKKPFDWYINAAGDDKDPFRLRDKYKNKFIINRGFDSVAEVDKICQQTVDKNINFVMSDHQISTSGNYNEQESIFTPNVIAQIMIALRTLNKGGSLCLKQYSAFEPFTISYIYALSTMFEECYIYKPLSSKKQNSELFIVCIGYLHIGSRCTATIECCEANDCAKMRSLYGVLKHALITKNLSPFVEKDILREFVKKHQNDLFYEAVANQIAALGDMIGMITDITNNANIKKEMQDKFKLVMSSLEKEIWDKYMKLFDSNPFTTRVKKFL